MDSPYLYIMLGIIVVVTAVSVPSIFRPKCPKCANRNWVSAKQCGQCGAELDAEG